MRNRQILHDAMTQFGPSIPIPPYGWLFRRRVFKACRARGGHFFHGTRAGFSFACCQCGYEDENPNLPKGRICDA